MIDAQPLIITARMGEPVVTYDGLLHLDGPAAFGAYLGLSREEQDALPPTGGPWMEDFDLPFARWTCAVDLPDTGTLDDRLFVEPPVRKGGRTQGDLWGWCASSAIAEWRCEGRHEMRRRMPTNEARRWSSAKKLSMGSGRWKPSDIHYPTRFAHTITWYALGDRARLQACLDRVTHIGKLCNQGSGRVLDWSVQIAHERDRDRWLVHGDWLQRTVPQGYPLGPDVIAQPTHGSIRAPHHHRSRMVAALKPVDPDAFQDGWADWDDWDDGEDL